MRGILVIAVACWIGAARILAGFETNTIGMVEPETWRALEQDAGAHWRQLAIGVEMQAEHSMTATRAGAVAWNILQQRLADPADAYEGITSCAAALGLPGVPREVYERADGLFWRGDYGRATQLFTLLVSTNNPDGFVLGNSHYWLGFLLYHHSGQSVRGLVHLLAAHRYPACLVYIDAAGREAAEIYYARGRMDAARAILAQQIPSIDYWQNEHKRAARGFDIARATRDQTNLVRNLLRMQNAAAYVACAGEDAEARRGWVADWLVPDHFDAIAAYLTAVEPWPVYQAEIISRALAGPEQGSRDAALTDLLLHDWPSLEDVAMAAPVVLTNRPLSNNVFPQRRRPAPHGAVSDRVALTNHLSELQQ
jgi:tetratricopeptide (TPR) repeat protein